LIFIIREWWREKEECKVLDDAGPYCRFQVYLPTFGVILAKFFSPYYLCDILSKVLMMHDIL
jgi:hypothetical protein